MTEQKLKDFVPIQRDYFRANLDGTISDTEFTTLLWLHYLATANGVVHASSNSWLANNIPVDIKPNTMGKLLKSLRNHEYIQFENRQGSRSGFKVFLMNWKDKNGNIRTSDNFKITSQTTQRVQRQSEHTEEVVEQNHMSDHLINKQKTDDFTEPNSESITSSYNENQNETENYKTNVRTVKQTKTDDFAHQVKSEADDRLYRIAESVGDKEMGFVFSIFGDYGDHGISVMEDVARDLIDKPSIGNKPAYFNVKVRRLLEKDGQKSIDLGKNQA